MAFAKLVNWFNLTSRSEDTSVKNTPYSEVKPLPEIKPDGVPVQLNVFLTTLATVKKFPSTALSTLKKLLGSLVPAPPTIRLLFVGAVLGANMAMPVGKGHGAGGIGHI